jgi:hypothetical protein
MQDDPPVGADAASLLASLPPGPWREAALAWAAPLGDDLDRAWADCPRGSWLLWLAGRAGVEERVLVLAAADCARAALELAPALDATLAPALESMVAWCRDEANADETATAVARAVGLASRYGMQAQAAVGDERRQTLLLSLVARAVARVAEGRAATGAPRAQTWPTSADLAAAAAGAATTRVREDVARAIMEARCAELVRARIPAALVVKHAARLEPGPEARPPCYVEVCITDEAKWEALAALWVEAGRAKDRGALEVDDPGWDPYLAATGAAAADARDALDSLRAADSRLVPPRRLDDFTARLELTPGTGPCVLGPAAWLVEAFGLAVVAYDDGAGRREGAPE